MNAQTEQNEDGVYRLTATSGACRRALGWLWLGLASLVLSGLFAVLIVLARTPYFDGLLPVVDFFRTALVVHVDLSVLVWFMSFAGVFWSLNAGPRGRWSNGVGLTLAGVGASVMVVAPFVAPGAALMSNYVPILQQPVFIGGLLLFACGAAVRVAGALFAAPAVGLQISATAALRFGLNTAAVAAALAIMALVWSYVTMPGQLSGQGYYEVLFWGGGHVLQIAYTQLMLVAWLWLASASGARPAASPRVVLFLFAWGLLSIFATPLIYLAYPVHSPQFRLLFTWQMEFGGSLASLFIGVAVLLGIWRAGPAPDEARAERAALVTSMVLFGSGGIIGFLIHGSNVTVPAHYHGCIVGITLAFMGMTYHLLPRLGYARPAQRLAVWQAYIYGAGQLLHIIGLAWSGGYGVQRKTAGAAQALDSVERIISMGLMGLGGLIAIIGGLLFLLVVFSAMYRARRGARYVPLISR